MVIGYFIVIVLLFFYGDTHMLKLSSNEAISFQPKSKFAKELVEIFQDVIDIRQKVKETELSPLKITKAVEKVFFSSMASKMVNCIQKHTGIPVGTLYISETFSACFACCVDFDGDEGLNMYTTIQRYSGLELDEFEKEYVRSKQNKVIDEKEIAKLASNFDVRTGKMNISKLNGKAIKLLLFFDYNAAFLVKETAHVKCEYMTAEEIAAIVLHEVGHMMTLFEHAADAYFKAVYFNNNFIHNFIKKTGKYEMIEYGLNFLENRFPSKKQAVDALRANVDKYKRDSAKSVESLPVFVSLLYTAIVTMMILLGAIISLPFRVLGGLIMPMIETLENTNKLSDYAHLRKQYKYCEQLADEFVSRHGLSHGLSSGLQKLFTWMELTGLGTVAKNSSLVWSAGKIPYILLTFFYGDLTDGGGLYDREYDRITRAMNNTLTVFRNEGLPKDVIDFYIRDYEMCKESVRQYRTKNKFRENMNAIQNLMEYLLATPVESIFTGRFLSEYNKLHNTAEQLIANSMGYHAAKLQQLLRKTTNK